MTRWAAFISMSCLISFLGLDRKLLRKSDFMRGFVRQSVHPFIGRAGVEICDCPACPLVPLVNHSEMLGNQPVSLHSRKTKNEFHPTALVCSFRKFDN